MQYAPGSPGDDGYTSAQVELRYAFTVAYGELVLFFAATPGSVRVSPGYWRRGREHTVDTPPPAEPGVTMRGVVYEQTPTGRRHIGPARRTASFTPLGEGGLLLGDTVHLGRVVDFLGSRPTPAQIEAFLNRLVLEDLEPCGSSGVGTPPPGFHPLSERRINRIIDARRP